MDSTALTKRDLLLAVAPLGIGLALFTRCLGCDSLWGDEAISVMVARSDWLEFIHTHLKTDAVVPLYYVLLRGWLAIGNSEAFIRWLSVAAALGTIPVVYLIGRDLFGRAVGFVAAALIAVNAAVLSYAQEARPYAIAMLLVSISTLMLVKAVKTQNDRYWIWYFVAAALAVLTQIFAAFVIVGHAVSLAFAPVRVHKRHLICFGLLGIEIAAVGLVLAVWVGRGDFAWVPPPSLELFKSTLIFLSGQRTTMTPYWLAVIPIVLLVIGMMRRGPERLRRWGLAAMAMWFLAPIVLALVGSLAQPMFYPRYLTIAVPGLCLLAAIGVTTIRPRVLAAVAFVWIVVLASGGLANEYSVKNEDWRGATAYVYENARAGDGVVFYETWPSVGFDYYAWRNDRQVQLEILMNRQDAGLELLIESLQQERTEPRRIWLVESWILTDRDVTELSDLKGALGEHHTVIDARRFYEIEVYLYERASSS